MTEYLQMKGDPKKGIPYYGQVSQSAQWAVSRFILSVRKDFDISPSNSHSMLATTGSILQPTKLFWIRLLVLRTILSDHVYNKPPRWFRLPISNAMREKEAAFPCMHLRSVLPCYRIRFPPQCCLDSTSPDLKTL